MKKQLYHDTEPKTLLKQIEAKKLEQAKLETEVRLGSQKNVHQLTAVRKDIARMLTALNNKVNLS